VLEAASVAGIECSAAAVAAGIEAEVDTVEEWCEGLVYCHLFLRSTGVAEWPDATVAARYGFLHALHQQVVYERVPASRRGGLHRRIGAREETA
jgi:predicted ATPase